MGNRKQVLETKLAANHQRLARESYLQSLSEDLSLYLSQCPIVQSPELDSIAPMFYIRPEGIGEICRQPQGYKYQEFSWLEQLIEAAYSVGSKYDDTEAFFYPFESNPLYRVKLGWVRENLNALFGWEKSHFIAGYGPVQYQPEQFGVVTVDFTIGLVMSHYCGYLDADPNPDEVVYELAVWGF